MPNHDPAAPILELDSATLVRSGRAVLDQVSLTLNAGQHSAIIGPNGSGKSSLVQLLTREAYPLYRDEGPPPIRLFGRERWDVTELRRAFGIVTPELHRRLVSGAAAGPLRGIEAVIAGALSSEVLFLHHRVPNDLRARASRALERIGALHLADRRLGQMSTGEARRVLIARALVHEPAVLVLDEPTTGLDPVARQRFLRDLIALAERGTTLLLVTHHLEEIVPPIERVVLLSRGRVAFDGHRDDALTSRRMSAVFEHPLEVIHTDDTFGLRLLD